MVKKFVFSFAHLPSPGFLHDMRDIGKTIVISAHDDELAHLVGDHIVYMNEDHTVNYVF